MANRRTDFRKRFLETDVLIVGAGRAGLRAAIVLVGSNLHYLTVNYRIRSVLASSIYYNSIFYRHSQKR